MKKRASLENILMILIIFFIPYTHFRMLGLKISEILTIVLVLIILCKDKVKLPIRDYIGKFILFFCITIALSAVMSLFDPINNRVYGNDNSIYYSFKFGWIFKIIRFFIIWFFTCFFIKYLKDNKAQKMYFDVYIISCMILDVWGIYSALKNGFVAIGFSRTALAAAEPSEAGFINCFAIIISLFLIYKYKKCKYVISSVLLIIGQLIIGSTASIICMGGAIVVAVLYLISKTNKNLAKKVFFYICFALLVLFAILYLVNRTTIMDKIINYKAYLDIKGSSAAERITTMQSCWKMFCDRPILGIGFGNFGWYIDYYVTSPLLNYIPGGNFQPNSLYFQLVAELGIIGFTLYIWLVKNIFKRILHIIRVNNKDGYGYMMLALFVYILIHNLTLTTLYSFQFWMLIAYITVMCKEGIDK